MNISLEWLREYLPETPDAPSAAEALTFGGLPVEVIEKVNDDTVIDVEVTSNRGDCLSHLGVARELSALMKRPFKDVKPGAAEIKDAASTVTSVKIEAPDLCPHYTARILRNVKIQPSPPWLAKRLIAIGLRPINNVVDVTNYVMFEMGQPLHAFDFDKLAERRIVVRRAKAGEKLTSIDGHERELKPDMLVIADAQNPVALAGVMGGRDSEVSDRTTNLLLESARFEPLSVRKTARALAMKSDSSYRFERGIDPTLPERASLRAAQLILETAGGELMSGLVSAGQSGYQPKPLSLRLARLRQVLGIEIPTEYVLDALTRMHLSPVLKGDRIDVTVPSHRLDLNIEIDLVEEVARVIGYDKIPVRSEIAINVVPPEAEGRTIESIRTSLVGSGYFEAVTFGFVSDALAIDFIPPDAKGLPRTDASVRKADANLRPSLLPGLLESLRRNESVGNSGVKFFEIGSTFWNDASGKLVERRRLGITGSDDVREVRGAVEELLSRLDAQRTVRVIPEDRPGYARGASGRVEWGDEVVGYLGKVDPNVAQQKLSLRSSPAAAELELIALLKGAQHVPQLHPLPIFPSVERDITFDLTEQTRYEQIESLVHEAKPKWLEAVRYVTTYRGKQLEKGKKSVTIALVFRSPDATLTSEQVEDSIQKITSSAKEKLGATLRV